MEKVDLALMVPEYNHQMRTWRGKQLGIYGHCDCKTPEDMLKHCRVLCPTVKDMANILGLGPETVQRFLVKYKIGG